MAEKVEGTLRLEGLIEGQLPDDEKVHSLFNEWLEFSSARGLHFDPAFTGNNFSLLADNRPITISTLESHYEQLLKELLEQLVSILPDSYRGKVLSTVRSVEYQKNLEVQSIFSIQPGGSVSINTREVEARTTAPEPPVTFKQKIIAAAAGVVILLILIGLSALFLDYKKYAADIKSSFTPFDVSKVSINNRFSPYFEVTETTWDGGYLLIHLTKTASFPDLETLPERYKAAGDDIYQKLALETLAKGYMMIEFFDEEGTFLVGEKIRISSLWRGDSLVLSLPIGNSVRPAGISFTYF